MRLGPGSRQRSTSSCRTSRAIGWPQVSSDDDHDSEEEGAKPKKKPAKKARGEGGGGGGNAFTRQLQLSDKLAAFTGRQTMGRHELTSFFWKYIKENDLKVSCC